MVLWEQVEAAELDEMWSFVGNKGYRCWLWLAIDRKTRAMLAYVFGQRRDKDQEAVPKDCMFLKVDSDARHCCWSSCQYLGVRLVF